MSKELVQQDTYGMGIAEHEERFLVATFYLGTDLFALEALKVQEIVRFHKMTPVPHAPDYVLGLINLRGQIVTAIDLRHRLTGESANVTEESMNLILKNDDGVCSVVVDDIGDVLEVGAGQLEPPPETMSPMMRAYVQNICKLDRQLLNILDPEKIISAAAPAV